jgi:hypothetical protein
MDLRQSGLAQAAVSVSAGTDCRRPAHAAASVPVRTGRRRFAKGRDDAGIAAAAPVASVAAHRAHCGA